MFTPSSPKNTERLHAKVINSGFGPKYREEKFAVRPEKRTSIDPKSYTIQKVEYSIFIMSV